MDSLEELFCHLDDFCRSFEPQRRQTLLGYGVQQRDMPLASLRGIHPVDFFKSFRSRSRRVSAG